MINVFEKERIKELKRVRKQIIMNAFIEGLKEYFKPDMEGMDDKDKVFASILTIASFIASIILAGKVTGKVHSLIGRIAALFGLNFTLTFEAGLVYAIHKAIDASNQIDKIVCRPQEG